MIPVSPGFKEYRETDMEKYLSEIVYAEKECL